MDIVDDQVLNILPLCVFLDCENECVISMTRKDKTTAITKVCWGCSFNFLKQNMSIIAKI